MIEPKYKIGECLHIPFIDHKRTGLVLRIEKLDYTDGIDEHYNIPYYVLDFLYGDIRYFKVDQIDEICEDEIGAYTPSKVDSVSQTE